MTQNLILDQKMLHTKNCDPRPENVTHQKMTKITKNRPKISPKLQLMDF